VSEMKEKIFRHGRGGSDAEHQAHQADIKALFAGHKSLRRVTERLPNGIRACTTSNDHDLAQILRRHAADMKARFAPVWSRMPQRKQGRKPLICGARPGRAPGRGELNKAMDGLIRFPSRPGDPLLGPTLCGTL